MTNSTLAKTVIPQALINLAVLTSIVAGPLACAAFGQSPPTRRANPAATQRIKADLPRVAKPRLPKVPLNEYFALPKQVLLTPDQTERLEELKQAYLPQLVQRYQEIESIYTPQRRESEAKALRLAREAGKNREQTAQAALAALYLTDEELETLNSARGDLAELRLQIRKEIYSLLTPEQQALLPSEARPTRTAAVGPISSYIGQQLRAIQLTAEQQRKIDEVEATFNPIYQAEVTDVYNRIVTSERKAAQREAIKAAKAAGKSKQEIEALQATIPGLDDKDRAHLAGARESQQRLQTTIRERILELLTAEQRAVLEPVKKKR